MYRFGKIIMPALVVLLSGFMAAPAQPTAGTKAGENDHGQMVKIPAGNYHPFLAPGGKTTTISLPAFYLDVHAVTVVEYLEFVKANPQWTRSRVSSLFADRNYLREWKSDFDPGEEIKGNAPITDVSWYAAHAYAQWKGKRLPSMAEWEYAAAARALNMPENEAMTTYILNWYSKPTPRVLPPVKSGYENQYGLYDMHGLIWEWVEDFNSVITGGDSRTGNNPDRGIYCAAGGLNAVNKKDYATFMRFAFRESLKASYTVRNLGFRCAMDADYSPLNQK